MGMSALAFPQRRGRREVAPYRPECQPEAVELAEVVRIPVQRETMAPACPQAPAFGIVRTWSDFVWACWQKRVCFVCDGYGWCQHRQPEAESVEMWWTVRGKRI